MLLTADADGGEGGGIDRFVAEQLMDHLDDGVPPVVRVLFGGASGQPREQVESLTGSGDDTGPGVRIDDDPLDPLGADIESQIQ